MYKSKWKSNILFNNKTYKFYKKILKKKILLKKKKIFIKSKNFKIPFFFNNITIYLYNGYQFNDFIINKNFMINQKFGNYCFTKKVVKHKKKK